MSSTDVEYINNLKHITSYVYKYGLLLFCIVTDIGNCLSLLIFFKKSWKKNVCLFYFKVYLLSNFFYNNSNILGLILIYGFSSAFLDSSIIICKLYFYSSFFFGLLSPTVLICASIDRLLISSQNVDTRLYSSKRLAYFSTTISTLFWILFFLHLLFKVNIQEIYPSYVICYYDFSVAYVTFVTYSMTVINVVISLLMIILYSFSFKNVRRIRAAPREKRTQQIRVMTKKDFQLLRCLFAHGIVYIIFGTAINGYYVYSTITKLQIRTQLEQAVLDFSNNFINFLYSASYSCSFFIFISVSKAFRHEFERGIYRLIGKQINPMQEENNLPRDNIELNVVSNIVDVEPA